MSTGPIRGVETGWAATGHCVTLLGNLNRRRYPAVRGTAFMPKKGGSHGKSDVTFRVAALSDVEDLVRLERERFPTDRLTQKSIQALIQSPSGRQSRCGHI